jgi:HlyD family secretion protein
MDRPVERKASPMRRALAIAGGVLLLIAAIALYPSVSRWLESETSVAASEIRIGEVTRGDLVRDVSVQGNVVAAFNPTLFSPVQGIARMDVKAGTVVAKGDPLGRVESPELESRLEQERSNLLSSQADLERQRIDAQRTQIQAEQTLALRKVELEAAGRALERAERTRAEGLLNAVEYESAQDGLQVSNLRYELAVQEVDFERDSLAFEVRNRESQVERQRLLVNDLERRVDELTLRSPVDGLVSRVQISDQDAVAQGTPLVTVVDLSALEVEVAIPESYADEAGPGTPAVIDYDGERWAATVKSISPEVEGARVRAIVAFTEAAPDGLKQNQRVSTRILFETRHDIVKVPRGPFLEAGGGRLAYRIDDGVAVMTPIEVGAVSVSEVEILSGLEIGDRIILSETTRFAGAKKVLLRR